MNNEQQIIAAAHEMANEIELLKTENLKLKEVLDHDTKVINKMSDKLLVVKNAINELNNKVKEPITVYDCMKLVNNIIELKSIVS